MTITPLYAALTTVIFLILSARVVTYRRAHLISLGDTGDKNLLKRMRAQANWVEYAPLGLLLLMMAEMQGTPGWVVHLLGASLTFGRLLHAIGFASTPQKIILRQIGMLFTLLSIVLCALGLLGHALF